MGRYYRLILDDYSAASFTSFSKDYFGKMEDIAGLFKAIREDDSIADSFKDFMSVYELYLSGDKKVTHMVAYQEVPFLVPAKKLGSETTVLYNHTWNHTNTWGCIYEMRCEKAESTHIWLSCHGKYSRCIQTRFTNLEYMNPLGKYTSHGGRMWGFPHQLEYESPITESRLFVVEKFFKNKAEAINDHLHFIQNPDPKFDSVVDDLFGDG
ncbi:MAG TPA: hypothetical protein DIW36_06425 [Ruminococcaceae bacterium]|nr:hypothetical protein [Oscillospiraceae bacterium]